MDENFKPLPRPLPVPGSKEDLEIKARARKDVFRGKVTAVMAAVLASMLVSKDSKNDIVSRPIVTGPAVSGNEAIRVLSEIKQTLTPVESLAEKMPRILDPKISAEKRCLALRDVLNARQDDILIVGAFLAGRGSELSNPKLRAEFRIKVGASLQMNEDEMKANPELTMRAIQKKMKNSTAYGVIQNCNWLVMKLFDGIFTDNIKNHQWKLVPIVDELSGFVQRKEPGAEIATGAFKRIVDEALKVGGR